MTTAGPGPTTPPPVPAASFPAASFPTVLGRVVVTMVPFAAVPWIALRLDGDVALLVAVVGLVAYGVVAASLFRVLEIPLPWVTGGVAAFFAALSQIAWTVLVVVGDLPAEVLENAVGLAMATVVGAVLAALLVHSGPAVPISVALTIGGVVAAVGVFAAATANLTSSHEDDEALRSQLESTDLPAFVPEFDGYSASSVTSGVGVASLDDGSPSYSISYRVDDGESYRAPAFYVEVRPSPDGTLCEMLDAFSDNCTETDGIARSDDGFRPRIAVARDDDDAVLVLEPGLGDDELDLDGLGELVPVLQSVVAEDSYDDLVDLR